MMNKTRRDHFWKVYITLTAGALLLMFAFFAFFYDYIGAYELSQPAQCAEKYVSALSDAEWKEMFRALDVHSQNLYEPCDMVADAYWQAVRSMPGTYDVVRDYSGGTAEEISFFVQKNNTTVAGLLLTCKKNGKYGFDTWTVKRMTADFTNILLAARTYTITVPAKSQVYINGILLDNSMITENNASYPFAHELERNRSGLSEMYTVTALYSSPEVECVWMGTKCVGEVDNDCFRFRYPDTELRSYTVTAPSTADVFVNGVRIGEQYVVGEPKYYPYSRWESGTDGLPTEITYAFENVLTAPDVTAAIHGVIAEAVVDGTEIHIPYPSELMYSETFAVPTGSVVIVNGHTLGNAELISQTIGYPELYGNTAGSPMMDVYKLEHLYTECTDVLVSLNGTPLPVNVDRTDREVHCAADFPSIEDANIQSVALSFCRDYFAYTSGGYKNTEENLNRVLAYLANGSELYRRIKKSQESISYVTPVTSHKYHELSIEQMRSIDDNHIMCIIHYDAEQWTYRTQRIYSGKLWLAFEQIDDTWMITRMLMDTK